MAADGGLLDIALAPVGQFAARPLALDDLLDDPLGHDGLRLEAAAWGLFLGGRQIERRLGVLRRRGHAQGAHAEGGGQPVEAFDVGDRGAGI